MGRNVTPNLARIIDSLRSDGAANVAVIADRLGLTTKTVYNAVRYHRASFRVVGHAKQVGKRGTAPYVYDAA